MKLPVAKAAVDKEWVKLSILPAWNGSTVRVKADVFRAAQKQKDFSTHRNVDDT